MTQSQTDILVRLAQHFTPARAIHGDSGDEPSAEGERGEEREEEEEEEAEGEGGEDPPPPEKKRKRTGTGSKKPRHPWGAFIRLNEVTLPPAVEKYLRKGVDPISFLADAKIMDHKIGQFGGEAVADAFVACYKYTLHLETRRSIDQFRWCFTMLMYFDMVRLIRLDGSGKVGPMMLQELETILGPVLEQIGVDKQQALERIDKWSLHGAKLSQLCDEFGAGCLFYLGDQLSVNLCVSLAFFFLPHNFQLTMDPVCRSCIPPKGTITKTPLRT